MVRHSIFAIAIAVIIGLTNPSPAIAQSGSASQFVHQLGEQAIATLNAPGATLAAREAQFRDLLSTSFDLPLIGRFVLGRYWKQATPDQQAEYLSLFSKYVLLVYASRLGGYAGETMTVVKERPAGTKDVVVDTRIDRPSGPAILAQWRVRTTDGRHRIIDIVVEGLSMAVTQRQEFAAVAQRDGVAGLIETLRAKTSRLSVAAS